MLGIRRLSFVKVVFRIVISLVDEFEYEILV